MIHQLPNGAFIDMSKLIHISSAQFINHMGHGGFFFGYDLTFQLQEKPIHVVYELDEMAGKFDIDPKPQSGGYGTRNHAAYCQSVLLPLMQTEVDALVIVWKNFKKEH